MSMKWGPETEHGGSPGGQPQELLQLDNLNTEIKFKPKSLHISLYST